MHLRDDFRETGHLRPLAAELGLINDASGSARFCLGNTIVVVSIHGPGQPRYSRFERFNRVSIDVEYALGNVTQEHRAAAEGKGARLIQQCVEGCVVLSEYPRQLIYVKVDIERDDGSAEAAAINATVLALLDAGIKLHFTPCAVSLAQVTGATTWLLDPLRSEEAMAAQQLLLSHDQSNSLLLSECTGAFSAQDLLQLMEFSVKATEAIRAFMRTVLVRSQNAGLRIDEGAAMETNAGEEIIVQS